MKCDRNLRDLPLGRVNNNLVKGKFLPKSPIGVVFWIYECAWIVQKMLNCTFFTTILITIRSCICSVNSWKNWSIYKLTVPLLQFAYHIHTILSNNCLQKNIPITVLIAIILFFSCLNRWRGIFLVRHKDR